MFNEIAFKTNAEIQGAVVQDTKLSVDPNFLALNDLFGIGFAEVFKDLGA